MSGSFIAKNIAVGTVNLGEWKIVNSDENLEFKYNETNQMVLKPDKYVSEYTATPTNLVSGTLILGDPINIEISSNNEHEVLLNIKFNPQIFSRKTDAYGFKLAFSEADTSCEVFYGDYVFGNVDTSNNSLFLTKDTLMKPLFFKFKYSKVPSSIACLLYPSMSSENSGGGLAESIPFGINFTHPKPALRARMMNFYADPKTSSAGGTVNENDTKLHGLVVVNSDNVMPSEYSGGQYVSPARDSYRTYTPNYKKLVEQNPTKEYEFLGKLVDRNGLLDVNSINIRFYQFTGELTGNYYDDVALAHEEYGSRLYKTVSLGTMYSSLAQVPVVDSHKEFTLSSDQFDSTTYSFNNVLVYKLSKDGHEHGISEENQNHATNLYVRFKLQLNSALYSNEVTYILPVIYINGKTTPIPLEDTLSTLNFDGLDDSEYGTYNQPGYAVARVFSGKPTISTYNGSYTVNKDLFKETTGITYTYYRPSWTWDSDDVQIGESLESKYILIKNTSPSNGAYVSIAFNGTAFEGSSSSTYNPNKIDILDNIRFTHFYVNNGSSSGQNNTDPDSISIGDEISGLTHTELDNTDDYNNTYIRSSDSNGSYVVHIPKNTTMIVYYTLLQLPDYLPADIYSQMYTITDITDYISKSTVMPIFEFKHGTHYYQFHPEHDEMFRKETEITKASLNISSGVTFYHSTNEVRVEYVNGNKNYSYFIDKNISNAPTPNVRIVYETVHTTVQSGTVYEVEFDGYNHKFTDHSTSGSETLEIDTNGSGTFDTTVSLSDIDKTVNQIHFTAGGYTYTFYKYPTQKVKIEHSCGSSVYNRNHPIYKYSNTSGTEYIFYSELNCLLKETLSTGVYMKEDILGNVERNGNKYVYTVKADASKHEIDFLSDTKLATINAGVSVTVDNSQGSSSTTASIDMEVDKWKLELKFNSDADSIEYETNTYVVKISGLSNKTGTYTSNNRFLIVDDDNTATIGTIYTFDKSNMTINNGTKIYEDVTIKFINST